MDDEIIEKNGKKYKIIRNYKNLGFTFLEIIIEPSAKQQRINWENGEMCERLNYFLNK